MSESPPSDSGSGIPGRPVLDLRSASDVVLTLYNVTGTASPLPSDRDQNFLIEDSGGTRYVLKVSNADEDRKRLEAQEIAADTAASAGLPVGRLIPTSAGDTIASVQIGCDTFLVRLVPYLEGKPLALFRPQSPALLFQLGGMLGRLDKALAHLSHPGAERSLVWDLKQTVDTITDRISDIPDEDSRSLVLDILNAFTTEVAPQTQALPHQIIHADANDYNVLIGFNDSNEAVITGLLDFGDLARTIRMSELAVACAYAMLDKTDPVGSACAVVKGYHAENAITENEISVLYSLIRARLGISVCMSAYQKHKEPENAYLTISERPVWALLRQLRDVHPRLATYRLRQACGLEPYPGSGALIAWLQSPERSPADVMDFGTGTPLVFDFSVGSTEWTPEFLTNPGLGEREIVQFLEAAGATTGLGRYDEARLVYTTESFNEPSGEMRTIHLGLDVFRGAGSPVYAPLDGTVYAFHDNDAPSNYGPTVILQHTPADGPSFYTLYGHLSRESLGPMRKGLVVPKGERFAQLGTAEENGGWIPHLHFQIIGDMLDWKGDFPGVAPASQRDIWTSLCPDPNLVCRFSRDAFPSAERNLEQIRDARSRNIGPSLSLSYAEPLHIVRGFMQHLFDAQGRRYLDAVNNVPHVGHSNPHVVEAGQRQMQTLNTNTRYLHDNLVRYAQRLTATFPDPLNVVFFVNSGSEANDLALRIARARTKSNDTIVIEGGYHGNLSSLIDISPYKFDGKGGAGAPSTTHVVPMPDVFRGKHREPDSGPTYAGYVSDVAEQMAAAGRRVTFMAESALSCGGQIFFPPDYLSTCYDAIRTNGGLCIADEVQVGMGRTGSRFWAFQKQNVIPDIVTIGKPIGNGHPLGAVITTAELADSFANGMEYFNTYGGNPVSCAIGMAVLDVLEQEHVQEHALQTGTYLVAQLRDLMSSHSIIGDVRGEGLFLGIELVRNRSSLQPATAEAAYVVNRMKELGVLLSTDGPLRNVLKIKPPMVFTSGDADFLVERLDGILFEDAVTHHVS